MFAALKRNGLKPHRVKAFKVSRGPRSNLKARDVVGLHVNPPDPAVAISVNEKTRIQAFGPTQTPLPMKRGHPETHAHDCKHNGTNCRMANFDRVAGPIEPGAPIHVIRDNVSSRKSADANEWLKDRPGRRRRFTPISASRMIAAEALLQTPKEQARAHVLQIARRAHRGDRGMHRASQRQ